MEQYNLTFFQRYFQLPIVWLFWIAEAEENRKTWHEVKKGMEKHEHIYTTKFNYKGYDFWQCEHEGCRMCNTEPSLKK